MRYVTLALTALMLVACSRDPNYLKQKNLSRGNDFFKAGKLKEASIMYRKAIENDRKFGEAYYKLALTELKQNSGVSAIRPLRIAVELGDGKPYYNDAVLKLAEIEVAGAASYEKNEQLIKDVQTFADKLLKKNPSSWEGHKLTGDLALLEVKKDVGAEKQVEAKKAIATAISEYRAALAGNAGDYSTGIALARALELDGEGPEAEALYVSLMKREKQNGLAYIDLYRFYLAGQRYPEAESVLKQAIQNNPKDTPFRMELARFYLGTNKRDDLVKPAQPDEERSQTISRCLCAGGRFLSARESVR